MDLTVHNTDLWWNMLIKSSKQIGNSFPKIINTKVNSKHCPTAEMEQVITGFSNQVRIFRNIYDGAFCKNSQKQKVVH